MWEWEDEAEMIWYRGLLSRWLQQTWHACSHKYMYYLVTTTNTFRAGLAVGHRMPSSSYLYLSKRQRVISLPYKLKFCPPSQWYKHIHKSTFCVVYTILFVLLHSLHFSCVFLFVQSYIIKITHFYISVWKLICFASVCRSYYKFNMYFVHDTSHFCYESEMAVWNCPQVLICLKNLHVEIFWLKVCDMMICVNWIWGTPDFWGFLAENFSFHFTWKSQISNLWTAPASRL